MSLGNSNYCFFSLHFCIEQIKNSFSNLFKAEFVDKQIMSIDKNNMEIFQNSENR